jgi:xanthine dehydrogenase accessory factor
MIQVNAPPTGRAERCETGDMADDHEHDPACAAAHGQTPGGADDRTLIAVFASPVADFLVRFGAELGFRCLLLEPDPERAAVVAPDSAKVVTAPPSGLDGTADVVVTDHHRPELGLVLRDLLTRRVRWIGVMGNPRHPGPHVRLLTELGVPAEDIARVHRPVGLNIGSRTPPEIAVATLAGLLADRNGRPGGFAF